VYFGSVGHRPHKTSIHASGISHSRIGEIFIKHGKGKKLGEWKGLKQITSFSIGNMVFTSPYFGKPYSGKRADGIVLIDLRNFSTPIGLMCFFLEPAHTDELNHLLKILREPQFFIFTEIEPWFVVAIFSEGIKP
jgi:hypothetical protein